MPCRLPVAGSGPWLYGCRSRSAGRARHCGWRRGRAGRCGLGRVRWPAGIRAGRALLPPGAGCDERSARPGARLHGSGYSSLSDARDGRTPGASRWPDGGTATRPGAPGVGSHGRTHRGCAPAPGWFVIAGPVAGEVAPASWGGVGGGMADQTPGVAIWHCQSQLRWSGWVFS
ncbi:hypothetical protein [Pseudomonas sp. 22 E 5]|nr:hypothetical protein [Pseudomonas sp. 22 E 5]